MSSYIKEKVVRVRVTDEMLKSIGLDDIWDLEDKFPNEFNWNNKPNIFEKAPTEEHFVDYILEYDGFADAGDYGFSRYLTKDEEELYLPKFNTIFPFLKASDLRIVTFCWYNCTEAPDYFDVE